MLALAPVSFNDACKFVNFYHRHLEEPQGYRFTTAVAKEGCIVGVLIAGRPSNRHLDDGLTVEVLRCCTLGHKNGPSMLYGAAARIAKDMGFCRIITYTLKDEPGSSLRGAGWDAGHISKGGTWNRRRRPRADNHSTGAKQLWYKILGDANQWQSPPKVQIPEENDQLQLWQPEGE